MRSDVKRETLRLIVVARDCKVSLRLMMRLTMMLTTDSANVSLCSNPRHWWPETLVTTALCNLQKNGWRHGKHKICQKSFTNNIFRCRFLIFLNCFLTSSLHISPTPRVIYIESVSGVSASSFKVHWLGQLVITVKRYFVNIGNVPRVLFVTLSQTGFQLEKIKLYSFRNFCIRLISILNKFLLNVSLN